MGHLRAKFNILAQKWHAEEWSTGIWGGVSRLNTNAMVSHDLFLREQVVARHGPGCRVMISEVGFCDGRIRLARLGFSADLVLHLAMVYNPAIVSRDLSQ